MHRCWNCGKVTGIMGRPARTDDCPYCRAELRCCRGCKFYDANLSGQCSEERAEPLPEKEKVNFCDFFVAVEINAPESKEGWVIRSNNLPNVEKAKTALDKLFGNK